jgi:hypothetical protein
LRHSPTLSSPARRAPRRRSHAGAQRGDAATRRWGARSGRAACRRHAAGARAAPTRAAHWPPARCLRSALPPREQRRRARCAGAPSRALRARCTLAAAGALTCTHGARRRRAAQAEASTSADGACVERRPARHAAAGRDDKRCAVTTPHARRTSCPGVTAGTGSSDSRRGPRPRAARTRETSGTAQRAASHVRRRARTSAAPHGPTQGAQPDAARRALTRATPRRAGTVSGAQHARGGHGR